MARSSIGSVLTGIKPGEGVRSYDVRDEDYPTGIMSAIRKLIGKIQSIGEKLFPAEAIQDAVTGKVGVVMGEPGMPKRVPPDAKTTIQDEHDRESLDAIWDRLHLRREDLTKKALAILAPKATKFEFPTGNRLEGLIKQLQPPEEIGNMLDRSGTNSYGKILGTIAPDSIGMEVNLDNIQTDKLYSAISRASETPPDFKQFSSAIAEKQGIPQVEEWQAESIGISLHLERSINFDRQFFIWKMSDIIEEDLRKILETKYFSGDKTYSSLFKFKLCLKGRYKGLFVFYFDEKAYQAQKEQSSLPN